MDNTIDPFFNVGELEKDYAISVTLGEEGYADQLLVSLSKAGIPTEDELSVVSFLGGLRKIEAEKLAHRILLGDKSALRSSLPAHQDALNIIDSAIRRMGPSKWRMESTASRAAVLESIQAKVQKKVAGGTGKSFQEKATLNIAKRIADGKLSTKNPQQIVDQLYRELRNVHGFNKFEYLKIVGAAGSGPLAKKDRVSRGLNSALVEMVKKNGIGGVQAASAIISLLGGAGSSGIQFDSKGNPKNLRKLLEGSGSNVKIPGKIQSLIKDDLAILGRETTRVLAANKGMSPSRAIAQALQNLREGTALTVKRRVTVQGTGKRVTVGGEARSKRAIWTNAGAPIVIPNTEEGIKRFEKALDYGLKSGGAFAADFVAALTSAPGISKDLKSKKRERVAATKARVRAEAKSTAASAAAAKIIKGPFQALSGVVDIHGVSHRDPISAYAAIRSDIEEYRKLIRRNGPGYLQSPDGQSVLGIINMHVSRLKELGDAFRSKEYTKLTSKERAAAWMLTGDTTLARAVGLIKEKKKTLSGEEKSIIKTLTSLASPSSARGISPTIEAGEKLLRGEIQFRKERKIMTPDEVLARDLPKFKEGIKRFSARTAHLFDAISKGKIFDEKGNLISLQNKRTKEIQALSDLAAIAEASISRKGGKFSGDARAKFLRESDTATEKRTVIRSAATKLYDEYKAAVKAATNNPSRATVEAAISAGFKIQRAMPFLHSSYLALGGKNGDILVGTTKREIQKSAEKMPLVLAEKTWLAVNPVFVGAMNPRKLPKPAEKVMEKVARELSKGESAEIRVLSAKIAKITKSSGYINFNNLIKEQERELSKIQSRRQELERIKSQGKLGPKREQELLDILTTKIKPITSRIKQLQADREKKYGVNGMLAAIEAIKSNAVEIRVASTGKPTIRGSVARFATLLSGEGERYGLYATREGKAFLKAGVTAPNVQAATGALEAALKQMADDLAAGITPIARRALDKQARAEARAARKATAQAVDQSAEEIAKAAGDSVVKEAKASSGRRRAARPAKAVDQSVEAAAASTAQVVAAEVQRPSRRAAAASQAAAAAPRAGVPVAAGGAGGGGGGGGGRRRTAASPGDMPGGVPPIGGKNISTMGKNAAAISQLFGALSTIAPVSPKKINEIKAAVKGIAEMMNELKAVSGGKISAKGLAAAMQASAASAGKISGGGGGGGGAGGGSRRLIGYALPGSYDLQEQERNISRFAESTSGILGKFADQIRFGFSQQIVGQISQGVGALLEHLQGGIIGFNAQLENSTVAFQTLFENEQTAMGAFRVDVADATNKANTLVSSIQNFANITPFRFPELVESARRMRAFGFETSEVLPNLQSIGDAVAALGGEDDKLNRITYALGQMKQSGRVYQNDMMQLANAGIAGYDLLARAVIKNLVKTGDASIEYLGQKIEAVQDKADKNKINLTVNGVVDNTAGARALTVAANRVAKEGLQKSGVQLKATSKAAAAAIEAINLIASQGPVQAMRTLAKRGKILGQDAARAIISEMAAEFRGGMDKLSKTFKGALSTLQDTSQYMVALITKPIYDGIRDAMYQAGQFFQSRAARKMAADFAASFAETLPAIGATLKDVWTIISKFFQGFIELGKNIGKFSEQLSGSKSILDLFRDGVSAIAAAMSNKMVRAAIVGAAAIKILTSAFVANPMLVAIGAIITGIGMLSNVYQENALGFRSLVNDYIGPMQAIVQQIQGNLIPLLAKIGAQLGQVFGGSLIAFFNLALPVLNAFLKILNLILEALNKIPGAANLMGVALAAIAGKKILGGSLFGSAAKFDASGNMIKAASGGILGGIQKFLGGIVSKMGGTIARQDIFQEGFKRTQAAKSVSGVIRAQRSAAGAVLGRAVESGAISGAQSKEIAKLFAERLEALVAGSKNAGAARAALERGGGFGKILEAVMKTAKFSSSTIDTALGVRIGAAAKDFRVASSGFARAVSNFFRGIKMFVEIIPRIGQSIKSFASGGSFLSGPALLGLTGDFAKKGIKGALADRLRGVAAGGLGLTGKAIGKIGIGQGLKGLFKSGVGSLGKLGGGLTLLGIGADVASGVDPMRAGLRGGLGFGGAALGGAIGSVLGPIGTLLGSMAGGFIGSGIGDLLSDLFGIKKETDQINQDLTDAQVLQNVWNEATKDGVLTYKELNSILESSAVSVSDLADQIQNINWQRATPNAVNAGVAGAMPSTLSPEMTFKEVSAGLGLSKSDMDANLKMIQLFTDSAQQYYENLIISKMTIFEREKSLDKQGNLINQNAIARARALAQAEIILMLTQQGAITSTDQLNQVLQQLAGKFSLTDEALKQYNLLTNAAAANTTKLQNSLNKAQDALNSLQRQFQLAQSALENRISMIFEKEMAKALEKAKDAFLETQTVMVEGMTWNLLALRKEIEDQEKKNRLLQVEKSIREATLNVEMARLATYDASIDPLEAAARLRQAEEAKTEAVKNAALERKKIALDEAMASTPIKEGLEKIQEYFDAAKLKFQEGMAEIMRLLEEGKISGAQAMEMIKSLYTTTFSELGVLDKNLEVDAKNFGDAFLGSWDSTVKKFETLADKVAAMIKKIKALQKQIQDASVPPSTNPTTDTSTGTGSYPHNVDKGYLERGYSQKELEAFAAQVQGLAQKSLAAVKSDVISVLKKNYETIAKQMSAAANPFAVSDPMRYAWEASKSKALASLAPGGAMFAAQLQSENVAKGGTSEAIQSALSIQKKAIAGLRGIFKTSYVWNGRGWSITDLSAKAPIPPGLSSGGTIMGPGLFRVGEAGTETMQITPHGVARVFPRNYRPINGISAAGGSSYGSVNASVIINNPTVRNDQDIRKMAEQVSRAQSSLLRSSGVGNI